MTTVVCERCDAAQEIDETAKGFVCGRCGETFYFVRCPGCSRPMQWVVGPKRQVHALCGRTVKLSRGFTPPAVERGTLVERATPWWHLPGTGLPFDLGEADYLGGHSVARKGLNGVTVEMQAEQIRVGFGIRAFVVPWSAVRGVHTDTHETLLERPVVTRMTAASVLDLACDPAPSYLVVETEGEALVFAFPLSQPDLESRCLGLISGDAGADSLLALDGPGAAPEPEPGAPEPAPAAARLLRELADLHAEGVLSDEEFAEKKAEILRRM